LMAARQASRRAQGPSSVLLVSCLASSGTGTNIIVVFYSILVRVPDTKTEHAPSLLLGEPYSVSTPKSKPENYLFDKL